MLSCVDAFVSVRDPRVTAPAEMGRFVPLQSFHLAVSTTEHNVGNLRGGNGIPARVATTFTNTLSGPSCTSDSLSWAEGSGGNAPGPCCLFWGCTFCIFCRVFIILECYCWITVGCFGDYLKEVNPPAAVQLAHVSPCGGFPVFTVLPLKLQYRHVAARCRALTTESMSESTPTKPLLSHL